MPIRFHITVTSERERGEVKKLLDDHNFIYTITGLSSYHHKKDVEEVRAEKRYQELAKIRFKLDDYQAEMVKKGQITRLQAINMRIQHLEEALGRSRGIVV
jgi:D-alanine-D-alanine ligase-like ATP-grasp enzyme